MSSLNVENIEKTKLKLDFVKVTKVKFSDVFPKKSHRMGADRYFYSKSF